MATVIDAARLPQDVFPTEAGEQLATLVLASAEPISSLVVDLTACKPAMLISAFFNAFLQSIHDRRPGDLPAARQLQWKLAFEFQRANVQQWMKDFAPASR